MSETIVIELPTGVVAGRRNQPANPVKGGPLIVAVHGGGYTSAYFDVPEHSLLDRAAARDVPAISLDRPGYGESTALPFEEGLLEANAGRLNDAIAELWRKDDSGASGVVLVGHSIGAATTILIAGLEKDWPLLGIAVSGASLASPPGRPGFLDVPCPTGYMTVPPEHVVAMMFGPASTYDQAVPPKAAAANQPVVFRELVEIVTVWPTRSRENFAKVRVPVHYRQAEHDGLVLQQEGEVDRVAAAFTNAPSVDAAMIMGAGHAIDFHHAGGDFQDDQIAFAVSCSKQHQANDVLEQSS